MAKRKKKAPIKDQAIRLCLLLLIPVVGLIVLLRWGIVGHFVYQLLALVFGPLTWLWIILICAMVPAYMLGYRFKKENIRWVIAASLFLFATSLWLAFYFKEGYLPQLLLKGLQALIGSPGVVSLIVVSYLCMMVLVAYEYLPKQWPKFERKPKKEKEPTFTFDEPEPEPEPEPAPVITPLMLEQAEEINPFVQAEQDEPDIQDEPVLHTVKKSYSSSGYRLPATSLLNPLEKSSHRANGQQQAKAMGQKLIDILNQFGVPATLVDIHVGPAVTKFEIKPAEGVRVNRISNLQYDLKMGLAAKELRIEAPIPGKNAVGIEVPNAHKSVVQMKELINDMPDQLTTFTLGKDLLGQKIYGRLTKMPHLLIAGATGSGKSVCVNAIICSILMKAKPDEVKLILIDPKKVEFTPYNGIPHLLAPVITDGEMANKALKVVVRMMDERYAQFSQFGVRNIEGYNQYVSQHPEQELEPMPAMVVIIDELADLMLVAAKEVEASIQRITQLARAAGIVLIVATQRPSVDVITGVIKANIPSRIAFAVSSAVDSRTILDQAGAERLLGNGDMLYLPNGQNHPNRIQGVFIQDDEVARIAQACKQQGEPQYEDSFITLADLATQGGMVEEPSDPLYDQVKHFVIQNRKASTSLLQRHFSIGYSRAARLMDILELHGIIGPSQGAKPRKVLVASQDEDS